MHPEPAVPTGKLTTPGALGQAPEGEASKAHSSVRVCVSPVSPSGGYRLVGAVNGVQTSLLLDTGTAVTLLRDDIWVRVTTKTPQELKPWSALQLVSADGSPLTIHGSARVKLELEGEEFMVNTMVVSPLTSEAILGLDFLQEQQALIDLASKRLSLRSKGCIIPLTDPGSGPRGEDSRSAALQCDGSGRST